MILEEPRPLTIEFLGLPGSGKTTLARVARDALNAHGLNANVPTRTGSPHHIVRLLRLSHARRVLFGAVVHPFAIARAALAVLSITPCDPVESATLLRYWIETSEQARRLSRTPGIHLVDQGLAQGVWSIAMRRSSTDGVEAAWNLLIGLPMPTVLVVVDAADDVLRTRLTERRGGGYLARLSAGRREYERGRSILAKIIERVRASGRSLVVSIQNDAGRAPRDGADEIASVVLRVARSRSRSERI